MTSIRRSIDGGHFVHSLCPPGRRVSYSIVASRELTRDECFAEVAKFLRANVPPGRGARIRLHAQTEPSTIVARRVEA